jgi:TetR/AcrR family transcriptional regulator, transcriptional repressor for nem operon
MGRPRGFDEAETIRSAAALFAGRSYDGVSVDDLVTSLGVHRNSLYKTFGSKRGLYVAALSWSLEHQVAPVAARIAAAVGGGTAPEAAVREAAGEPGLDLLLLAATERAPSDAEVARLVGEALAGLDRAAGDPDALGGLVALALGLRIRTRFAVES